MCARAVRAGGAEPAQERRAAVPPSCPPPSQHWRGPDRHRLRDRHRRGILRTTRWRAAQRTRPWFCGRRPSAVGVTQLKRTAKRAALRLDPASAERKHQRAVADRHIRLAPAQSAPPGCWRCCPAAQAQLLYDRVDGAARLAPQTHRTMDQLRADALVNAVLHGTHGEAADPAGAPAGHQRHSRPLDPGRAGRGAGLARRRTARFPPATPANSPTTQRNLAAADHRPGHRPTAGLRHHPIPATRHLVDHVTGRDGECTFPFCSHHARRSDLDHIAAYRRQHQSRQPVPPPAPQAPQRQDRAGLAGTPNPRTGKHPPDQPNRQALLQHPTRTLAQHPTREALTRPRYRVATF